MNTYQYFNPYYRNTQILHSFFSKPFSLIVAICFSLQPVLSLIGSVITFSITGDFTLSIPIGPALVATSFYILYFKSKKPNPASSLTPAFTLLMIYAILLIVASGILILCSLLLFLISIVTPYFEFFNAISLAIVPHCISNLLSGIAMIIFVNSLKKSTNSIYLHKKGSLLTFVSFIISAIIYLFSFFSAPNLTKTIANDLQKLFDYIGFDSDFSESIATLVQSTTYSPIDYVVLVISLASVISISIFAFMYYRYIKNISETITIEPQSMHAVQPEQPTANIYQEPIRSDMNQPNNMGMPINFEPQPVFSVDEDAPEPLTRLINNKQPQSLTCSNCGNALEPHMKFCGKCGHKL